MPRHDSSGLEATIDPNKDKMAAAAIQFSGCGFFYAGRLKFLFLHYTVLCYIADIKGWNNVAPPGARTEKEKTNLNLNLNERRANVIKYFAGIHDIPGRNVDNPAVKELENANY
jgi:hypothetical protein